MPTYRRAQDLKSDPEEEAKESTSRSISGNRISSASRVELLGPNILVSVTI